MAKKRTTPLTRPLITGCKGLFFQVLQERRMADALEGRRS